MIPSIKGGWLKGVLFFALLVVMIRLVHTPDMQVLGLLMAFGLGFAARHAEDAE